MQYAYEMLSPADLMTHMPKAVTGVLPGWVAHDFAACNVGQSLAWWLACQCARAAHTRALHEVPYQACVERWQRLLSTLVILRFWVILQSGLLAHAAAAAFPSVQGCRTTRTAAWPPMCGTPGGTASPSPRRAATSSPSSSWSSNGRRCEAR